MNDAKDEGAVVMAGSNENGAFRSCSAAPIATTDTTQAVEVVDNNETSLKRNSTDQPTSTSIKRIRLLEQEGSSPHSGQGDVRHHGIDSAHSTDVRKDDGDDNESTQQVMLMLTQKDATKDNSESIVKVAPDKESVMSMVALREKDSSCKRATPNTQIGLIGKPSPHGNLGLSGEDKRWRAHRLTEDYMDLVGNMMYPATYLSQFGYDCAIGQHPTERTTTLGMIVSSMRKPTVVEKWSPYEISIFESTIALYGKDFHTVQKAVKTKSTKEIIEFYYIWKKTRHYKLWKNMYVDFNDLDSDDED